ncbi:zonular occludens toxin domain-containing protein [Acinetobacter haemolyticus]|uniref:zonular occludens toxin domain-containing protein n=1 Tax=Acinetobacter haemolyticus TaxID=29430 RepID=UPI000C2B7EFA|nr:zonular occludens toxin domain-containing protein [Acinetobacter haemolyticus]ATZ66930.1 hypothetical protein BSR56_05930 [Acinetobacter haemolyticus]
MIILTTGTPGSGKTLFAVSKIIEREQQNEKHLKLNPKIFERNYSIIEVNCDKEILIESSVFDGDQKLYEDIRNVLKHSDNEKITLSQFFDEFQSFSGLSLSNRYETYFYDSAIYNELIKYINNQLDLKLEYILDVRQQYSDINGLKVEHVLKTPEDWRTTPDGSIVYYDEAQQHERFRSGTSANRDEIVQKLQVHRHTGHDIWFITQSPRFLNAFVLDLVGEHYHLHRPYGAKLASVYYWRSCRKQPQSQSSKEVSENEFLFKYPKYLFNYYKSATSHSVKFKIPKKVWYILLAIIVLLIFVFNMLFNDKTQKFIKPDSSYPVKEQSKKNNALPISQDQLSTECRKGINVEKPECVKYFDELSAGVNNENGTYTIKYDPNKPYDVPYDQFQYQVTSTPQFVGCVEWQGKYYAYTQQGTRLNVPQSDCERYMSGDRPFNPMYQPQQQGYNNAQVNNSVNYQNDYQQNIEQMAKIEQAKMEGLI